MEQITMEIMVMYSALVNIFAFILMGIDKQRAKSHRWRISERSLLGTAFLGGALGTLIGMYVFHHKTKHLTFKIGVPSMLILHFAISTYLFY